MCLLNGMVLYFLLILLVNLPQHQFIEEKLVFVQALWRHGDRTPIHTIPTDPDNGPDSWPNGLGELTPEGTQAMFKLGQLLRKKYDHLIDPCALHSQVYIRSTDCNRTISSALTLMSGFDSAPRCIDRKFDTDKTGHFLKEKEKILLLKMWSPFPVHSVPDQKDILNNDFCPKADKLYDKFLDKSSQVAAFEVKYRDFIKFISAITNQTYSFMNLSQVSDTLDAIVNHADDHKLPKWANQSIIDMLNEITYLSFMVYNSDPTITKLRAGPLLWQLEETFRQKISTHSPFPDLRFSGYSSHDYPISSLLTLLGVYDSVPRFVPDYSSVYLFEMYKIPSDNKYFIKLETFSPNSHQPVQLQMSNCPKLPALCSFEQFTLRNKPFVVKSFEKDCKLDGNEFSESEVILPVLSLVASVLVTSTLILLCLTLRLWRYNRRKYGGYYRVRLDNMADELVGGMMMTSPVVNYRNGEQKFSPPNTKRGVLIPNFDSDSDEDVAILNRVEF